MLTAKYTIEVEVTRERADHAPTSTYNDAVAELVEQIENLDLFVDDDRYLIGNVQRIG